MVWPRSVFQPDCKTSTWESAHSFNQYLLRTSCVQARWQELILRTRHSSCPGVHIFQKDYWKITVRLRQPGIGLIETVLPFGFYSVLSKSRVLRESDRCKAVLPARWWFRQCCFCELEGKRVTITWETLMMVPVKTMQIQTRVTAVKRKGEHWGHSYGAWAPTGVWKGGEWETRTLMSLAEIPGEILKGKPAWSVVV